MSDLSLRDDAMLRFEDEFDRIFYGDEVFASCSIQMFKHSNQWGWFTWSGRTSDQIQSFLSGKNIFFDTVSDIGENKLFKFLGHSIDFSHHYSDSSCLEKSIYPIWYAVFRYKSKISFLVAEKLIKSLWISLKKLSKNDFHGFITEFTCSFLSDDFPVISVRNTLSSGQMKIRNVWIFFYQSQDLFYIKWICHPITS